jgi:hypothetical protein
MHGFQFKLEWIPFRSTTEDYTWKIFLSCEKDDGDTRTFKFDVLFILGSKYLEILTCLEEYITGLITIINKLITVGSQHSQPL